MPPRQHTSVSLQDLPGPWLRKLTREHLDAAERLLLLQTNWGLAASVLQEAQSVRLSICSQGSNSVQQRALDMAAEGSSDLHVKLRQGVPEIWHTAPKHHITSLTLVNFNFTSTTLQQLRLQECQKLHTLHLKGEQQQWSAGDVTALTDVQRAALLTPTLKSLTNAQRMWNGGIEACLVAWIRLLRKQLTNLDMFPCSFPLPAMLALTHLRVGYMFDWHINSFILAPNLQYVTIRSLMLSQDHSSMQIQWQQLQCEDGAGLKGVLCLPLRSIKRLVIHGGLHCSNQQQVEQFSCICPRLLCVPFRSFGRMQFTPKFGLQGHFSTELAAICAQSLWCHAGYEFNLYRQPYKCVLPIVAQLPANILLLCFTEREPQLLQPVDFWASLVSVLPSHIRSVVFNNPSQLRYSCACASALLAALQARGRHESLTITVVYTRDHPIPDELQQLAQANPGRVVLLGPLEDNPTFSHIIEVPEDWVHPQTTQD